MHASDFALYEKLQAELKAHQASCAGLVDAKDGPLKQFRFDCKRAVNTPVGPSFPL